MAAFEVTDELPGRPNRHAPNMRARFRKARRTASRVVLPDIARDDLDVGCDGGRLCLHSDVGGVGRLSCVGNDTQHATEGDCAALIAGPFDKAAILGYLSERPADRQELSLDAVKLAARGLRQTLELSLGGLAEVPRRESAN